LLVGFTITPLLWNYIAKNHSNSLSAGRCQTPALKIIYENYKELLIETKIYKTIGYFTNKNIAFELSKEFETESEICDFLQNTINFHHTYSVSIPKRVEIAGPEPLITSTLQQLASNDIHLSPKDTMKYAQQLYENGLITYMRTDSKIYSKEFILQIKKYIEQQYNDTKYIKSTIEFLSEERKEAHEAIRPVSIILTELPEIIEPKAKKLYELIRKRTLESCMSDVVYSVINAEVTAYSNNIFKHKSQQTIFQGWTIISNKKEENQYNYLLSLKPNKLNYNKINATMHIKNIKSHYTEAKLVQMLEEKGIGRPSTFATLIDKIQQRGYVIKENIKGKLVKCTDFMLEGQEITKEIVEREFGNEKNKLVIQPLGIMVIEFLIKYFDNIFNYDYTKKMETALDLISDGVNEYPKLCKLCLHELNEAVAPIKLEKIEKYEIKIDKDHTYIIGKYGPIIKKTIGKNIYFLPIKKDFDLTKLEQGSYVLEDLLDNISNNPIGKYQDEDMFLHKGKYGIYVQWGDNKRSLQELGNKPIEKISFTEVFKILEKDGIMDPNKPIGMVREITSNISIRKGKFGDYIFYKNNKMKKPQFLKLQGFKEDYKCCEKQKIKLWIKEKYNIDEN
jgi:DNA topoisomerase-1